MAAACAALLITLGAKAQDWARVQELYQAGMYAETTQLLEGVDNPTAAGWRALCALSMQSANAHALALHFIDFYSENILAPQVRFLYALDLFDRGSFEEAMTQFSALTERDLYPGQRAEYLYKWGYSAFGTGDWEKAKALLGKVRDLEWGDYSAPSFYTLGYIHYAQGKFKEASEWFLLAAKDYRFESLANYYILECRFNEKDYAYVVKFGEDLFNKVPEDRQPHLARIMSESYLVLGNVGKARSYYEENLVNKLEMNRTDYFYAGEVHYLIEDWQGAVDNFSKIENRADSLGQIASYQMGYSYIKLRNKVAAMDAFKDASVQEYSEELKEDAFYNYAKLAFDLGRDTAPFQEYLDQYGTKKKGDQIYSYIAMVALQNHDYVGAVEAYDHIDYLDPGMKANYMKAYMLRARELMESGSWRAAIPHLKAAAYYSSRKDGFNQLARYYEAEANYRDGKYPEARTIFNDLYNSSALYGRPEGSLLSYQLAYTYFKEASYERALRWFQTYLDGDASLQGADAATRVGDCYFFRGDYASAVGAYEKQMTTYFDPENLYPAFRAGVACGLINDNERKVQFLEGAKGASPSAPYYGESLYELGRAYIALQNEEDAIRTFKTLHGNTKDPSLSSRSLLELGMIERNAGRSSEALAYYKQVVAQGGEYAEDALLAIESIYRTREDPDAYLAYVNSLGSKAQRTEAQKEEVYFSSAEQVYLSGDYSKAITALNTYLERYPQALFGAKARFYLAESYRLSGVKEQAADLYLAAMDQGLEGALSETALVQYAGLQYELGSYAKAYKAYLKLKETAQLAANKSMADIGLMRSAFKARQWEDALAEARIVLDKARGDAALSREALYVQAKSKLSTSQRESALADFRVLAKEPSIPEGAEATYLLIQDQFDRASFDDILDKVYAFSEKAGGQNYWLAKAFIVLGDTYVEQGNEKQARVTFESIRDGYTPSGAQDDVLDQVELRLRKLQN